MIIVIIDIIDTINTINTIGTIGTIISISLRGRQSRSGALSVGIGKAEAERLAKSLLPKDCEAFSGVFSSVARFPKSWEYRNRQSVAYCAVCVNRKCRILICSDASLSEKGD